MKKPRTKWIHADEMAFLKQYLKRNRYSTSSTSIHSNENNNLINHLTDKDILSATDAAFLMTLTTMKSNEHDLSNSNQSGSHVDYYDTNGQTPSPTHSVMNLSMMTNRARSQSISSFNQQFVHKSSNDNYTKTKNVEPNHVDVETCDDNGHDEYQDEEQQDNDDNDKIQHSSKKLKTVDKQEMDDDNGYFDLNNFKKVSSTSNGGEKMKRITLEAPESMLICFDVHHHNNHSRHHHNNSAKLLTPTTGDDVTGSEIDIFADYVAMKLKSFSVTNRLDTMTKIWHLLSETTLRQYSTSPPPPPLASLIPIITPHCPPGSTNLATQDLR